MDLVAFLRARIGEDAAVARAASHPDQDRVPPGFGSRDGDERWQWVRGGKPEPLKGATSFAPREGAQGGHQWVRYRDRDHVLTSDFGS